MSGDNVKSADRVLRILEQLAASPEGMRAAQVGKALGIPISSCLGLLTTMVNVGFVKLDSGGRIYSLTDKVRQMGAALTPAHPLEDTAIHCARQLHRELGIPVAVSRRVGLFIEWAFTLGHTHIHSGSSLPIFKTLNGMAVLSHMSEAKLANMIDAYNERFGRQIAVHARDVVSRVQAYRGRDYVSGGPPGFPGVGTVCFYLHDSTTDEEVLLSLILPINELATREPAVVQAVRQCVAMHGVKAAPYPVVGEASAV